MDRGPLLTSAIIFYLAIGAAIFEVLEEPHWKEAKKSYYTQKLHLLKEFPCLGQEGLDKILQVSRRPCPYILRAGQRVRSAEGLPFTALDNPQSPWVVLGVAGKDVSHGSGCWDLSFTGRRRSDPGAEILWEPGLSREKLRVTPRVNQVSWWLGVSVRVPPCLEGGWRADKGIYLHLETLPEFGRRAGCHSSASPPPSSRPVPRPRGFSSRM